MIDNSLLIASLQEALNTFISWTGDGDSLLEIRRFTTHSQDKLQVSSYAVLVPVLSTILILLVDAFVKL